jgi:hypothetical protein
MMPLNPPILQSKLNTLFQHPPDNIPECAAAWSDAMSQYAGSILPVATTVELSCTILESNLNIVFQNNSELNMLSQLEQAFNHFGNVVGVGMLAAGYITVSPKALVGFGSLTNANDFASASSNFSSIIHSWLITGTAQLAVPPYTLVNWS